MPKNKNAYIRYRMIDSLLRESKYIKTKRIIEKLEEKHDLYVGDTTSNKEYRDMQMDLGAPIPYCHKNKAYYYPDDVENIFPAIDLQPDEVNALAFYARTLQQYRDFDVFKDFTSAIDKVVDAVKIKATQNKVKQQIIIQPENHPKFKGSELIPEIIAGFDSNNKVQFDYQKHTSSKIKTHVVTPVLLKEFDHLWYLIGQIEGKDFVTTFALDRITNFVLTESIKEEIANFDHDEYYNHVFGIAVPDGRVEEVILEFESWRGKYLLAAPIHKTQRFIEEKNGKMYFSFKLIPYHELYAKILSYGENVKVVCPDSLVIEIKAILEKTLGKY